MESIVRIIYVFLHVMWPKTHNLDQILSSISVPEMFAMNSVKKFKMAEFKYTFSPTINIPAAII